MQQAECVLLADCRAWCGTRADWSGRRKLQSSRGRLKQPPRLRRASARSSTPLAPPLNRYNAYLHALLEVQLCLHLQWACCHLAIVACLIVLVCPDKLVNDHCFQRRVLRHTMLQDRHYAGLIFVLLTLMMSRSMCLLASLQSPVTVACVVICILP